MNDESTTDNVASEEGESIRQVIAELEEDAEKLLIRIRHVEDRAKAAKFMWAQSELLKASNYVHDAKTHLNLASTFTLTPQLRNARSRDHGRRDS